MKFKTTIKIVTDAKDKNEAMEIAGEYLSGHLATGVDMELRTTQVTGNMRKLGVVLTIVFIVGLLSVHFSALRHQNGFLATIPSENVIQPPLKTSIVDDESSDFKKRWQTKHSAEVLNSIK